MVKTNAAALEQCRRLYEAMFRFDMAVSKELGLHVSDVRCVNALETGPLTPGQIGKRLGLTSGSVSAMLDRMERRGVISRETDQTDKRRSHISLQVGFYDQASEIYGRLGRSLSMHLKPFGGSKAPDVSEVLAALAHGFDESAPE